MRIEIKKLYKNIDGKKILEDVNMSLTDGNIYGFVGNNGTGKTVLLKILCGLYEPTNGSILFDGINILEDKNALLDTRIALDNFGFIEDISGKDNLLMLANIQKKINKEDVNKTLEIVGLSDEKNELYRTYSTGTKKKLCIAQTIMENSSIMIFDDLFNGLDEKTRKKISDKLLDLKKNGRIIIISAHSISDIKQIADVVYMIENNKVLKRINKK